MGGASLVRRDALPSRLVTRFGTAYRRARSWSACRGSAPAGSYPARRDCPLIRLKNAWLVRSAVERTHIRVERIGPKSAFEAASLVYRFAAPGPRAAQKW